MKTRVIQDEPEPNDRHFAADMDTNSGERPIEVFDRKVVADPATHDRHEPADADTDGGPR